MVYYTTIQSTVIAAHLINVRIDDAKVPLFPGTQRPVRSLWRIMSIHNLNFSKWL